MRFACNETATGRTGAWRRLVRSGARSIVLGVLAATVIGSASAQSPIAMYAYSRETLPGIPGGPGAQGQGVAPGQVFPTKYYLFVQVKRGSQVSARWVWVRGSYYDCTLTKVRTPVTVESDPGIPTGRTETLVPKTENDVYRVDLGNTMVRSASNDQEKELVASNQAVIALAVNKSMAYAAILSIKALRPAAAM